MVSDDERRMRYEGGQVRYEAALWSRSRTFLLAPEPVKMRRLRAVAV